jgi:hypothetical protein
MFCEVLVVAAQQVMRIDHSEGSEMSPFSREHHFSLLTACFWAEVRDPRGNENGHKNQGLK